MEHLLRCSVDIYWCASIDILQSRKEFESELVERFGSLVKMPLLKSDRYLASFLEDTWLKPHTTYNIPILTWSGTWEVMRKE